MASLKKRKVAKKPVIMESASILGDKSLKLIHRHDFLLAFEVEIVYNAEVFTSNEALEAELKKIHNGIGVGRDGSIRFSRKFRREATAEIRTAPLVPMEALKVLGQVFDFINKFGYTNKSCGLHLNFSPTTRQLYYSLNPFTFTADDVWEDIRKEFKREDNEYCRKVWHFKPKNLVEIWSAVVYNGSITSGHYSVVNMQHYSAIRTPTSRIEIRGFGNIGYHKRYKKIVFYTERIFKVFLKNCTMKPSRKKQIQSGTSENVTHIDSVSAAALRPAQATIIQRVPSEVSEPTPSRVVPSVPSVATVMPSSGVVASLVATDNSAVGAGTAIHSGEPVVDL